MHSNWHQSSVKVVLELQWQWRSEFLLLHNAVIKCNIRWPHHLMTAIPAVSIAIINLIPLFVDQRPTSSQTISGLIFPSPKPLFFQSKGLQTLQISSTSDPSHITALLLTLHTVLKGSKHAALGMLSTLQLRGFLACCSSEAAKSTEP